MSSVKWETETPERVLSAIFFDGHTKYKSKKGRGRPSNENNLECLEYVTKEKQEKIKAKYIIDGFRLDGDMVDYGFVLGNDLKTFVPLTAYLRNRPKIASEIFHLPNKSNSVSIVTKAENESLYSTAPSAGLKSRTGLFGDYQEELLKYALFVSENEKTVPKNRQNVISFPPFQNGTKIVLPTWYDRVFSSEKTV
jgi:hypothetical protein